MTFERYAKRVRHYDWMRSGPLHIVLLEQMRWWLKRLKKSNECESVALEVRAEESNRPVFCVSIYRTSVIY